MFDWAMLLSRILERLDAAQQGGAIEIADDEHQPALPCLPFRPVGQQFGRMEELPHTVDDHRAVLAFEIENPLHPQQLVPAC